MPKLSITFKDVPLETIDLRRGETGIGRDPSNEVHIDSLAIADFHAVIRATPEGYVLRRAVIDLPVLVNNAPIDEHLLEDGDKIVIGKHSLYFINDGAPAAGTANLNDPKTSAQYRPFEGSFQVMNGKHIGMVIPLKATVTQIGKEATGMIVVTKGEEGYKIAPGSGHMLLTINGHPLDQEEEILKDGDIVRLNSALLQFFQR